MMVGKADSVQWHRWRLDWSESRISKDRKCWRDEYTRLFIILVLKRGQHLEGIVMSRESFLVSL